MNNSANLSSIVRLKKNSSAKKTSIQHQQHQQPPKAQHKPYGSLMQTSSNQQPHTTRTHNPQHSNANLSNSLSKQNPKNNTTLLTTSTLTTQLTSNTQPVTGISNLINMGEQMLSPKKKQTLLALQQGHFIKVGTGSGHKNNNNLSSTNAINSAYMLNLKNKNHIVNTHALKNKNYITINNHIVSSTNSTANSNSNVHSNGHSNGHSNVHNANKFNVNVFPPIHMDLSPNNHKPKVDLFS
jgi:hypothetical protein